SAPWRWKPAKRFLCEYCPSASLGMEGLLRPPRESKYRKRAWILKRWLPPRSVFTCKPRWRRRGASAHGHPSFSKSLTAPSAITPRSIAFDKPTRLNEGGRLIHTFLLLAKCGRPPPSPTRL